MRRFAHSTMAHVQGVRASQEQGLTMHRYCASTCQRCVLRERRINRWEHVHVLEAVQQRIDEHPELMRRRRETVEHTFGTFKSWIGSTHFQMRTLPRVRTEMALRVLAYNLKRVMNIYGIAH